MISKFFFLKILILLFELKYSSTIHLTSLISQNGIHGEITFYQDPLTDGKIIHKSIYVTVNLFHKKELADNETWTWYISQFPVDYAAGAKERCSREMIGDLIVDLGDLFGPITFLKELNQTYFEFETGNETFSLVGPKGVWGHSLVLLGPFGQKACGTISVTDEYEEKVGEAKFHYPLTGSVYFRWAGSHRHNVTDSVIFSKLIHVTNHSASQHNWKIFVTDILDSEADKSRENCDFLQIVLNPSGSNSVTGDLTSRLGKVVIADVKNRSSSKSIFRDAGLSSLPIDLLGNGRSLYLVLFDAHHSDSFFACAKIRHRHYVTAKAVLQAGGVAGSVSFSQRTRFDPTWVMFNVTQVGTKAVRAVGVGVHELPVEPSGGVVECGLTGPVFDPNGAGTGTKEGSQDAFAVGDLSGKHGGLAYLETTTTMWDTNLPLFGPNSVVHRSLVFYKEMETQKVPWVCANLLFYKSNSYNAPAVAMFTASVIFRYPVVGSIVFRQPKDQPWMDTTIIVESLIHADGTNKNDTFEHRWSVNEFPPGKDFYNWTGRCLSAGEVFDPFKMKSVECDCSSSQSCRLGDLSGRLGTLNIAGSKTSNQKVSRKLLTDSSLSLSRTNGIVGKSMVLYDDHGPVARGDRLACSKILPIYRRKAVVKSWHSNGDPATVSGKFEFLQQTKYDITNIDISMQGLVNAMGYHIHLQRVLGNTVNIIREERRLDNRKLEIISGPLLCIGNAPVLEQLEFPCEDSVVYGHFNPKGINPLSSPPRGTPDQYEVGDLSRKFDTFENKTTVVTYYNDSSITLFGPESILGRSIVIHKKEHNRRWVCSRIERGFSPAEARELRAIASFHHPGGFAYGYIRITQLVYNDGSKSDSVIEVNLRHPGKQDRNVTRNHNWAIYVNPVSVDAAVKVTNTRCTAAGYVWNPYYTQLADPLNEDLYRTECGPDNPLRCYVGDVSARLGTIDLGHRRQVFSDVNFPLEGEVSAMGRSIVIFAPERGSHRFACANIEPDKDIIKYVNIRRTPRFVAAQFLEEVRDVMGVPEWFINIDSRKTKILHSGNCIQFLIHFKGPEANILERDFSILMATGRLHSPSLYIPGFNPSSKRKTTISHGPCGSEDPHDGFKARRKLSVKSSGSVIQKNTYLKFLWLCIVKILNR